MDFIFSANKKHSSGSFAKNWLRKFMAPNNKYSQINEKYNKYLLSSLYLDLEFISCPISNYKLPKKNY